MLQLHEDTRSVKLTEESQVRHYEVDQRCEGKVQDTTIFEETNMMIMMTVMMKIITSWHDQLAFCCCCYDQPIVIFGRLPNNIISKAAPEYNHEHFHAPQKH